MKEILLLVQKLRSSSGSKLYLHLVLMLLVSCLEGIGIFLIIPLLSLIGAFDMDVGAIPFISAAMDKLQQSRIPLNLPIILLLYVALVGGQALLQRNQTILGIQIEQRYIKKLRIETHESLLKAKWEFFMKRRNSDFNQVLSTELNRVSSGINMLLSLVSAAAFTLIQVGFAMWLSPTLTSIIIASGLLLSLISRKFVRKSAKLGKESTALFRSYFAGLSDHFNGIKDLKSNLLEFSHIRKFTELCGKIEANYVRAYRVYANSQFLYRASSVVLIAVFAYASIKLMKVAPEQLLLVVLIFTRLWPRFITIQSSLERMMSQLPAMQVLTDLQKESREARESILLKEDGLTESLRIKDGITCDNVSYRYDKSSPRLALRNINVSIPVNQMTAIVGKSGAGKSTFVDMLMGLIEPEEGEVLVDGKPLTEERLLAYRQSIGYVAQEPFLFHGTLRENLQLVVPDATEEQMWESLRFSSSDEFVRRLPDGLDTIIGDRGVRLSGGERQRIVLARAVLRKPSVLVLDEATSALDSENEVRIKEALDRLRGKMTIIVIAHRMSTIRHADKVIVLDNGEIVQQGGYMQLSQETRGTFRKLLSYQTGANA
ncbi:ATP-binding cassette subfamily C protein [Paenibacillus sp. BK033]|uniref:ABC transporter ATP-binding protein n=1 Tax=Paenibacillus sp. BK033 TaxID=2512133 RepID=UPI001045C40E|nr:ABC transporter ATP-binding protein [Paenibacillus sp. BK033]TCN00647.1 ATP-binding cassette subfamily C protein [Paenibacillus sp. BK033]